MKRHTIEYPLQGARIEIQTVPCIHGKQYLATAFSGDVCLGTDIVSVERVEEWRAQSALEFKLRAQGVKREERIETFDAENEACRRARSERARAIAKGAA